MLGQSPRSAPPRSLELWRRVLRRWPPCAACCLPARRLARDAARRKAWSGEATRRDCGAALELEL